MNVLFNTQSVGFQMMGGLAIQMLKTKKCLEQLGVNVKLFDPFHDKLEDFDILHIFGSYSYELVPLTKMAKEKNIPIAISSIYWQTSYYRKLINFESKIIKIFSERYVLINPSQYLFSLADILLPNSKLEAEHLIKHFDIDRKKIFVVPNGVENRFLHGDPNMFIQNYGIKDFVLFVGHIQERKNVLRLITAMNDTDIPLVIIGTPLSTYYYYNVCRKEANDNIHFLGYMDHDSELLASAYSAAKVFAFPSWAETPGLAALEAGLAYCNLVITNKGSTTEYFKNFATYCNPISVKSIRNAIVEAYNREKSEELSNYILEHYTWDVVAKKTIGAYDRIVNKSHCI